MHSLGFFVRGGGFQPISPLTHGALFQTVIAEIWD